MCVYCNMGDHTFRFDPPWRPPFPIYVPQPVMPPAEITPWSLERLREYRDLLREIKELEDKAGCPCVPNKADYIGMFEQRIGALENGNESQKGTTP